MSIHAVFHRIDSRGKRKGSILQSLLPALFLIPVATLVLSACQKEEKAGPPPPVVEVAAVITKDVPIVVEWVGTLDGLVNAVIRPQVQGYLIKQNYREGDSVRKGQVLFEIDPREFEAAVTQARGTLAQTKAALEKAKADVAVQEARWNMARANLARIRPLAQQNAVSQKDLDDAVGTELSGRSSVEAAKAAVVAEQANISAAEANLEKALLNLGFTKIVSPVDGIAGIAKTQLGNLVGPSMMTELTVVSTVNPIKAYINVSEQEYLAANASGRNREDIQLDLILADGSVYPHKGKLVLADRQIDPTTGTLKVGSIFDNPGNRLRPGGYGLVKATMSVKKGALLIPQRSVTDMQGKYLVAVVGADNKVAIRPVKVAERIGSDWIISEGLKPGEKVVVEGTQKVRPDMVVNPQPFDPEAAAKAAAAKAAAAATGAAGKPEAKPAAPAPAEKR